MHAGIFITSAMAAVHQNSLFTCVRFLLPFSVVHMSRGAALRCQNEPRCAVHHNFVICLILWPELYYPVFTLVLHFAGATRMNKPREKRGADGLLSSGQSYTIPYLP